MNKESIRPSDCEGADLLFQRGRAMAAAGPTGTVNGERRNAALI